MQKQTKNRIPKSDLINLLIEFVNIYGREPKQQEKYKNANIGTFLSNVKHGNTALSSDDRTLLTNFGIKITSNTRKSSIHKKVLLLVEFYNLYHRTPKNKEVYKDVNIETFLSSIRQGNTTLSDKDALLLTDTGIRIISSNPKDIVHKKVLLLIEFYNLYHRTPKNKEVYKDVNIGTFLSSIRQGNTTLSDKDALLLTDTGIRIISSNRKDVVHKRVLLLIEFYNLYNRTPKPNEIYKNISLYNFLVSIRRGNTTLSSEDKKLLIETGIRITSKKRQYTTHEKALLLVEFYNLYHRHPKQKEEYKGFNIGTFLYSIRQNKATLSSEDKKLLIDTGIRITSNKRIYSTHEKALLLVEFYNLYNRVPKPKEIYKNIKLGIFLSNIKQKMINLSTEDEEILLNAGIKTTPKTFKEV